MSSAGEGGTSPALQRWETAVTLTDGGSAELRPVKPDDVAALSELHRRLSPQSVYRHYFTARPRVPAADIERAARVDYRRIMSFVASVEGQLVAIASYFADADGASADVAFEVDDAHHGRGLATLLLEALAAYAWEQGIRRFTATVLGENRAMLDVFRDAGYPERLRYREGTVDVELDIAPSEPVRHAIEARHRKAAQRARRWRR